MTTLTQVGLHCPVCYADFFSFTPSKVPVYNKRTDFHERTAGTQPLPFQIHQCKHCGFAAHKDAFDKESEEISPKLRDWILKTIKPEFGGGFSSAAEKYEASALVAAYILATEGHGEVLPNHVGDLYLRAAWCCVDEGGSEREEERFYRRKAIEWFILSLSEFDTIDKSERATYVYLVGELLRRVGKMVEAKIWLSTVQAEIVDTAKQAWVHDMARRQLDDPQEWIE